MNQIGICIWCRLPWRATHGKSRIGNEIGNQAIATKFSHFLTDFFFEKIKDLPFDFYLYHAPCDISETYCNPNVDIRLVEIFEYDSNLSWMQNTNRSLDLLLNKGYSKAIACVSDCPYIEYDHFMKIIDALDCSEYAILPAKDKGINAYGVRKEVIPKFKAENVVSRSCNYSLLQEILKNFGNNHMVTVLDEYLPDIDCLSDITGFYNYLILNENRYKSYVSYKNLITFLCDELIKAIPGNEKVDASNHANAADAKKLRG